MFGWFQRLLPKKGDFFGLFEAHAATLVEAANALRDLSQDGGTPQQLLQRIQDHEHDIPGPMRCHEVPVPSWGIARARAREAYRPLPHELQKMIGDPGRAREPAR